MESRRLSISGVLKDGFKKTFSNFGTCFKGLLGLAGCQVGASLCAIAVNIPLIIKLSKQSPEFWQQATACGNDLLCLKALFMPLLDSYSVLLLVVLVASLLLLLFAFIGFTLGFLQYNLNVYDKGKDVAKLRDLEPPIKKTFRFIAACLLFVIICAGGLVLLVLPGIYWATRFILFTYFIIDKDAGIVESLKMSWAATAGSFWPVFVILFSITIINAIGNMFILFYIFTAPLAAIMGASLYRKLTSNHDNVNEA